MAESDGTPGAVDEAEFRKIERNVLLEMKRNFLPYRPRLTRIARMLRNNMTLSEVLLWNRLKQKQIMGYDFHRQKPIDEFVVDFFCPKLSLVVEIDGESHQGKLANDSERQQEIERYGIHFLRFPDDEVKANLDGVVEEIQKWIEKAEKQGRSRRPSAHS